MILIPTLHSGSTEESQSILHCSEMCLEITQVVPWEGCAYQSVNPFSKSLVFFMSLIPKFIICTGVRGALAAMTISLKSSTSLYSSTRGSVMGKKYCGVGPSFLLDIPQGFYCMLGKEY